jgi:uncharacterized repeat protein (TIGR01451 family)
MRTKSRLPVLGLFLALFLSFLIGTMVILPITAAAGPAQEGEDSGCFEIEVEKGVFAINPELNGEELQDCQNQIQEELAVADAEAKSQDFVPGQLLVGTKPGLQGAMVIQGMLVSSNVVKDFGNGTMLVEVPVGSENNYANSLNSMSAISWVEPNYRTYAHEMPTLPTKSQQLVGVTDLPDSVTCNSEIGVAVLDTGIAITHTELIGHAYYGYDFVDDDNIAEDQNGHGTSVASQSVGTNIGICRGGTVVGYRVLNENGSGTNDWLLQGIIAATADSRVKVINISLGGGPDSEAISQSIADARAAGKVIVISSGNDLGEYPSFPSRDPLAISVGATDYDYRVTPWSSRFEGKENNSLVAPGANVLLADYSCADCYKTASGTSFSAPAVSGAFALVWGLQTEATPIQIESLMLSMSTPLGDAMEYGLGALDVSAAVRQITGGDFNRAPKAIWTLPTPSLLALGEEVEIIADIRDLDGDVLTATVTITRPGGLAQTFAMEEGSGRFWSMTMDPPPVTGTYTATVSVTDAEFTSVSGVVNFHVMDPKAPTGYAQEGGSSAGGSFVPLKIDIESVEQAYEYTSRSGGGDNTVVYDSGRAAVPMAVRVESSASPWASTGVFHLFNPEVGIEIDRNNLHTDTLELTWRDVLGMFPESAALGNQAFVYDEGFGNSNSQDAVLHSYDPVTGQHFWNTKLEYHASAEVRLSKDGERLYVVSGAYDPMWAIDSLTGERLWSFLPSSGAIIDASPVEGGGLLYLNVRSNNESKGMYALNPETGNVFWHHEVYLYGNTVPVYDPVRERVYTCGKDVVAYAFDANTGDLIWQSEELAPNFPCDSTPALFGDSLVLVSGTGTSGTYMSIINVHSGEVVHSKEVWPFGNHDVSPVVVGDIIFLTSQDTNAHLRAYQLPELEVVWEAEVDPYASSQWQLSAATGEDENGEYVLLAASGNNFRYQGWKFYTEGSYIPPYTELSVSKSGPVQVESGETITYTINVENIGTMGTNVVVTDILPIEFQVVDLGGAFLEDGILKWDFHLEEGQSRELTFTGFVETQVDTVVVNEDYAACADAICWTGSPASTHIRAIAHKIYLPVILR